MMAPIHRSRQVFRWLVFTVILSSALISLARAKQVTDAFGRQATIPDRPSSVYSASPPLTYLLYALDPAILAGLNFPVREGEKRYLNKRMLTLPVVGRWFGQAQAPNMEAILKIKPEVIVIQQFSSAIGNKMNESVMKSLSAPLFQVRLDSLSDYPDALRFLGQLLGRETRARELSLYVQKTLSDIAAFAGAMSDGKRTTVYYAEGMDGLTTECNLSGHAELINLAGGRNVHRCPAHDVFGMEPISLEQVMLYDPDVILVKEETFFKRVFGDSRWERLRAVKEKRVFLIPYEPFNWFDRPPSFMRFLGVKWVASRLYPGLYPIDMMKETRDFFRFFLRVDLTTEEARKIMYP